MSVRSIEFLSALTPIPPSLGIEQLNDLESNSKRGPCYSRYLEILNLSYLKAVERLVKLACIYLEKRLLIVWKYNILYI